VARPDTAPRRAGTEWLNAEAAFLQRKRVQLAVAGSAVSLGLLMRYFDLRVHMRFLLWLALAACSSPLKAQIALNPYTGRYEIAPRNAAPRLNPLTGEFEIASPGSVPKYNAYQGTWQMAPKNSVSRFNPYSGKWEVAPPDARLQFNPYTSEWSYPR
jgi:hypothetical protein